MSQWEYVVKEVRLSGTKDDEPEGMEAAGSTLPDRAKELWEAGKERNIWSLSVFGNRLERQLEQLGKAGWEVYHIERLENKRANESDTNPMYEVNYRLFAKRRAEE